MKKWSLAVVVLIVLVVLKSASIIAMKEHKTLRFAELVIQSRSTHETTSAHTTTAPSWVLWMQALPPLSSREIKPLGWQRPTAQRCKRDKCTQGQKGIKTRRKKRKQWEGEETPPDPKKQVCCINAAENVTITPVPTFRAVDVTISSYWESTITLNVEEASHETHEVVVIVVTPPLAKTQQSSSKDVR